MEITGQAGNVHVVALNDRGQVTGAFETWGASAAFVWDPSGGASLLALPADGIGAAINDAGQVAAVTTHDWPDPARLFLDGAEVVGVVPGGTGSAGVLRDDGRLFGTGQVNGSAQYHAFTYIPGGSVVDLTPNLDPYQEWSVPVRSDHADKVAINIYSYGGPAGGQAGVWEPTGGLELIPYPPGAVGILATKMNAVGSVIGGFRYSEPWLDHAFFWSSAGGTQVLAQGVAVDVNDSDQVIVADDVGRMWEPILGFSDIGTTSTPVQPIRVNNSGVVVGTAGPQPFWWTASGGLVELGFNGGTLAYPELLNDAGQVAGWSDNGRLWQGGANAASATQLQITGNNNHLLGDLHEGEVQVFSSGSLQAGVKVGITVGSGPNQFKPPDCPNNCYTDANGIAPFRYRGTKGVGPDLIHPWIDTNEDGHFDSGEIFEQVTIQWDPPKYAAIGDSTTTGFSVETCKENRGVSPYGCEIPYPGFVTPAVPYPERVRNEKPIAPLLRTGIWGYKASEVADDYRNGKTAQGDWAPQLIAAENATELVTVSIGINDLEFSKVASWIGWYRSGQGSKHADDVIQKMQPNLDLIFDKLEVAKNRGAEVVVLGYFNPYAKNYTCGLTYGIADLVTGKLSSELQRRSTAKGFLFTDLKPRFVGHGAGDSDPWVFGTDCNPDMAAVKTPGWLIDGKDPVFEIMKLYDPHPNNSGTTAQKQAVLEALQ